MVPVQVVSVSCRLAALLVLAVAFLASLPLQAQQAQQAQQAPHLLQQVDPFIGVDGHGAVFPGAVVPFGMVSLSPDMVAPQETSGYRSGQPVIGFSHNHSSGTGGTARYGNLLVAPQSGPLVLQQLSKGAAIRDEQAAPGYYAASLAAHGIRAELTSSARSGVHRYTFPEAGTARVLLDVSASRNTNKADKPPSSVCTASDARVVGDRRFEGQASFEGGWGGKNPHKVYFVAEFDRPFARAGGWQDGAAAAAVDVSAATDAAAVNVSGKHAGL